jgi:O-antigen ligase
MWRFFSEARVQQLSLGWGILIVAGLFLASTVRALPSIGIAGLFLTSVGYSLHHRRIAQRAHWPALLSFVLIYLLHLITGLWHSSLSDPALRQDLVLELPFVLLPVSFLLLPDWQPAHKRTLWLVLLGCCLVAAASATANYLLHLKEINQIYLESRVMPTEPDHIRFSLLVSMAVLAGTLLIFNRKLPARLRQATAVGVGLLFLFQHLLAARSGLVTMYAGGGLWLGWLGWQLRRWKDVLRSTLLIGLLAGTSLLCFTTLQNKIVDTQIDAGKIKSVAAANNYSVTARVYSYDVAWDIIRAHPLGGVSKIKLADAMAAQYAYRFPQIERAHYLLPHNQFIFNAAAYGMVGLLVFLLGFYYPLWVGLRQRNILLLVMYLIVSLSFLVEYTLETQTGVLTGLFFILLAGAPGEPAAVASPAPAPGPTKLA